MQNDIVREYYDMLAQKKFSLFVKRIFEIISAVFVLVVMSPILLFAAIAIKIDSKGHVFYRQVRVTRYNKDFRIFKFRTMVNDADKKGPLVTVKNDDRITRVGKILRKTRIDEFPQMLNILKGDMSLVGMRPEVRKYVDRFTEEQMAALLLSPGITGAASIQFRDENDMLDKSKEPETTYIDEILPIKMNINLEYIKGLSFWGDIKIVINTIACVFKR